jgi:UDP-glucose 4-epimerase
VSKSVLVTGAGGFVCRHIVTALLDAGYGVVAVERAFDTSLKAAWAGRVELLEADVSQLPSLTVDCLIHGAAVTANPEQAGQTPEANFRANVEPVLAALEWSERRGVGRAIFISSGAVYRETQPGPVYESDPALPTGIYAVAKHTMERLVETLNGLYGRDVVAVRLSNIYGPGEQPRASRPRISLIGSMIHEALETGCITVPAYESARDWTFAPDIGRAICAILEVPRLPNSLYNMASERAASPLEIADMIRSFLPGVDLAIETVLAPEKSPVTRRGYLSSEQLRRDIGFADWTDLSEGLRQTVEWQRQHSPETAR